MRKFLLLFFGLTIGFNSFAQSLNAIKGKVLANDTKDNVTEVQVSLQGTEFSTFTTADGTFILENIPNGEYVVQLSKIGYENLYLPVTVENQTVDLGEIAVYPDFQQSKDNFVITLTEEELSEDEAGGADNIAGLLQSSNDAYQQAVAFNFSSVFFQERGYDSSFGQILFNGIPMNKFSNGRPQWSDWGGINDMMRNDEFTSGIQASDKTFGNVLGSTNYITRASKYRKGGQVAYAATNSNYDGRVMGTYNTGLLDNGWAFSISAARRYAQEGYMEGSAYNANSFFLAIEKVFGNQSLNLTAMYTPNRHGKNSPNTQEVFDLGGTNYNAYWGWQEGEKRNSRVKEIKEPTFFLSHDWDISKKTSLSTNLMYQFGTIGDSRLGYDANNPDPTYYKKLPSYYMTPGYEDYQTATEYTYKFLNNEPESQIMWSDLYDANFTLAIDGNDAAYYLYEDVVNDNTFAATSILKSQFNDNIQLNASVLYKNTLSENYAHMMDLLGADYQIDVDKFEIEDTAQNDLNHPNRQIKVGDKFSYDYNVNTNQIETFGQLQANFNKLDLFFAANVGQTTYQREGLYKNGKFSNTSYGKGEKLDFLTLGTKGGITYKLSGRNLISLNAAYMEKAPTINNSFSNSRVSNITVPGLTTTKIATGDISYIYRAPGIKARLTGYYTTFRDLTKVSYYFVQGVSLTDSDEDSEFLATALSGLDYRNFGGEFGVEIQATPTVSFTGVASMGQYTYDSNPDLYTTVTEENANNPFGTSYLKNYKQSGTPQGGYSVGFTYRDPNYWWVSTNANLLTNNYISLSEFRRTDNFFTDSFDGQPITGLTQEEVDRILAQEKLDDVFLVNLVGGKSWKINDYYVGFFASVNNLLGEKFHSGGFEQARKANYTQLSEDQALDTPQFGNKYWYGRGTSYYINLYFRF